MRVLTVRQPMAWAIMHGKSPENRGTLWSYIGPVAIHAGAKVDQSYMDHPAIADLVRSEPGYDGLGHTSSTVGEGAPIPREARATVLDALPRPTCAEVSGPAGPESTLLVHQRAGGPRLGEAS